MAINYGSIPFDQQVAYFNAKKPLPSTSWNDLQREMHDTTFVVAGAVKADLLADLHEAMSKAHELGTTLAKFRKDFADIVAKRGWTGWTGEGSDEGVAWRTRVIYETNLRTSYQAGRWQQIQAVQSSRPYLMYKHSHAVLTARAEHLAWDGLIMPMDSPWVKTHYPPNGYGCKCTMFTLSERDLQRLGKPIDPNTTEWTDPTTGKRYSTVLPNDGTYDWKDPKTGDWHTFPKGIQPYWDYTPGASLSAQATAAVTRKIDGLPPDIGGQLKALIKSGMEMDEQAAMTLGVKNVDYQQHRNIAQFVNAGLSELSARGLPLPDNVLVHGQAFGQWAAKSNEPLEGLVAAFLPHPTTQETYLFLNPFYPHWDNPLADAVAQQAKGVWSTGHERHILHHELGHLAHYRRAPAAYQSALAGELSAAETSVAGRVSLYAADGPAEFVAETFAGLLIGKHFDAEIITLYQKLHGPDV
ncbi:MAG: phage minor head protein [Methylovulum sp.]|nr:phage minor head protein [Methylovulum sp.]